MIISGRYDVIVVGAGPAGCTAAKTMADEGYRVLLVEKFKMPRYKSCSGQLIRKSLDLVLKYYGESVPDSVTCEPAENKGMVFVDDKGCEFKFEQSGLNVWRSSFDKWLCDKAAQAGVEVRDATTAISCEDNVTGVTVTLKGMSTYQEHAKYVIDCEGATGSLKRKLTGERTPLIATYQTFNDGSIDLDYHYFYAYLQPELSEYDAWFNVKDSQLVLGVSVKDIRKAEHYYSRFLAYMTETYNLTIKQQNKVDKWFMPKILPGCRIDSGVGKVFFAGETAGFLNPMGEGISGGMESGYHIASAIAHDFDQLDAIYTKYEQSTASLHEYMKHQWSLVARMTGKFKHFQ